jgi:precorrin-6B methylase 2
LEQELDAMVSDLQGLVDSMLPDEVIQACAAMMARCTEIHMNIVRVEGKNRHLRWVRTQQLTKVMELIEFTYKAASRIVEIRRQDTELSR